MPRFETEQDLLNEEEVVRLFTKGKKYEKLGDHDIDYLVPGIAYIEVKCTPIRSDQVPVQMLSLIKLLKMQEKAYELPTYLVYRYSDRIMYIELKDIEGRIKWDGRTDRGGRGKHDQEMIVWIPKDKMKTFMIFDDE